VATHRLGEVRADRPAGRSGHHAGAHDEPGVVVDPGQLLGRFDEARVALAGAELILQDLGSDRELAGFWYVTGMVAWLEGDLLAAKRR
jgi:hypothetical protein